MALCALVEERARVGWHGELLGVPACGTGERGAALHGRRRPIGAAHDATTVAVYLSVATAAIIGATVTGAGSNVMTALRLVAHLGLPG